MISNYGKPKIKGEIRLVRCISSPSSRILEDAQYYATQHDVDDAFEIYDLEYKYVEAAYKYRFVIVNDAKVLSKCEALKDFS